jgi:glycine/D-amino acid oxidase-like deaminating enzyme
MTTRYDVAVIGGGLVGSAIAFGMRSLGGKLAVFDEGDVAHRAARGNFGLIWVQGKGAGLAAYASWTQRSAREWPAFASALKAETGIDVALAQPGGLSICLSRRELDTRIANLTATLAQPGFERYRVDVLDREAIAARVPAIGRDVVGGTWTDLDGHCNPLKLMHALHAALARSNCVYRPQHAVTRIEPHAAGFALSTAHGTFEAERVIVAAGLGTAALAPMVGVAAPVRPNKGHTIVLERLPRFLDFPIETIRQTDEGTVLVGDSQQERGFDEALDIPVLAAMAERATRAFPHLADARVVRSWAALRVMTPDGLPVYRHSPRHARAFVATSHSGVTLAAAHARVLAPALLDGALPDMCAPFATARFDVPQAA